jgi:hypothetical protein
MPNIVFCLEKIGTPTLLQNPQNGDGSNSPKSKESLKAAMIHGLLGVDGSAGRAGATTIAPAYGVADVDFGSRC